MSAIRRPSSIDGIKRVAKHISRARAVKHHEALDEAARLAGFQNFKHAQRMLEVAAPQPLAKPRALEDFHTRSRARWSSAVESVNPTSASSVTWTELPQIVAALSPFIGRAANHAHLPSGGGLDYETIGYSRERGCLEFGTGARGFHIAKPRRLILEQIEEAPAESFLLLELAELRRALPDDEDTNARLDGVRAHRRDNEQLVEVDDEYFDYSMWGEGHMGHDEYGDEIPFPESTRIISRWLRGRILFVCKGSLWNGAPATYDGRHNQMSSGAIRGLIERTLARMAAR